MTEAAQVDAVETLASGPESEEDAEDEESIVSTGIPAMDHYLDNLDYAKLSMAYALVTKGWYNALFKKVRKRLEHHMDAICSPEGIENAFRSDPELKAEWSFWSGFEAAALRADEEL